MPRIHDRVMVEATFNPSMPFKWNAYRVQAIQEVGGGAMPQQIQQSAPPLIQRQQQPPPMQMPPHMQSAGGPPNRWSGPNDRSMRDEPLRDPRGVAALDRHRANARRASPPPRREGLQSKIAIFDVKLACSRSPFAATTTSFATTFELAAS